MIQERLFGKIRIKDARFDTDENVFVVKFTKENELRQIITMKADDEEIVRNIISTGSDYLKFKDLKKKLGE